MGAKDFFLLTDLKEPHHLVDRNVKGKGEWTACRAVSALIAKRRILLALPGHEVDKVLVIGQSDIDRFHNLSLLISKGPPAAGEMASIACWEAESLEEIRKDHTKNMRICK